MSKSQNAVGYRQKALRLREKGWDEGDKKPLSVNGDGLGRGQEGAIMLTSGVGASPRIA
jgi:hypothetical protein